MSTLRIIPLISQEAPRSALSVSPVTAELPEKRIPWDLFLRTGSPLTGESSPLTLLQFIAEKGSWDPFQAQDWDQFVSCRPSDCRSLKKLVSAGLIVMCGSVVHPTEPLANAYQQAREKYSRPPGERILDSADPDHPMHREKPRPGWRSIYDEPAPALS